METLKSLLTVFSFIALLSLNQGCLPDSFKKFKQGTPKSSDGAGVEDPEPTTTDDFNPDELNFPTKLAYAPASPTDSSAHTFKLVRGEEVNIDSDTTLLAFVDGDLSVLSDPDTLENGEDVDEVTEDFGLDQSGGGFSLTTSPQPFDSSSGHNCPGPASQYESSLPKGLEVDKETGVIFGTPSEITADGNGAPLTYCLKLAHIDENENFSFKEVRVEIAVYEALPDSNNKSVYENGDKMVLELGDLNNDIKSFSSSSGTPRITTTVSDGTVASQYAQVDFIDQSNLHIFIDRAATANGRDLYFGINSVVDNNSTFIAKEALVTDVTNVYPVSTSATEISLKPRYSSFICVDENGSITPYDSAVDCHEKAGSCSDPTYQTRTTCNNAASNPTWNGGKHNDPSAPTGPAAPDGTTPDSLYDAYTLPGYLSEKNAVKFFVDQDLPPSLSFDQETGKLEGYIDAPLSTTTFNVVAIGPFHPDYETATKYEDVTTGDNAIQMKFKVAVVERPQDLSLSNTQIIEVSNSSLFQTGDVVTAGTPEDNRPVGVVLDIMSSSENRIFVRTKSGEHFKTGAPIDNRFPYTSAKAYIYSVEAADVKLSLSSVGSFSEGDSISSPSGGKGIIQHIDSGNNDAYIKLTSTSLSGEFYQGENVDDAPTYSSSVASINSLNAYSLKVDSSGTPSDREGSNILSSSGASGVIQDVGGSANINYVTVNSPGFQNTQSIDHTPYDSGTDMGTINNIAPRPSFYYFQDEYMELKLNLNSGQKVSYKFDPALPPGISFNPDTMKISGTPTERLEKTQFLVTASNSVGSTSYQFELQIYDFFELALDPPENEEYVSYILHKEGRNNKVENCRITRSQINSNRIEVKNINCYLDAGEAELNNVGVDLKLRMPRGVCQQIGQVPYYFYQYIPRETPNTVQAPLPGPGGDTIYKHTGTGAEDCGVPNYSKDHDDPNNDPSVAIGSSLVGDEDNALCLFENGGGDYSNLVDLLGQNERDAPNCDEGNYNILPVEWVVQPFVCLDSSGNEAEASTARGCFDNNGTCSANACGGGTDPCETYQECTDAGETWTADGSHNDPNASTTNPAGASNSPDDIYSTSVSEVDVDECDSELGDSFPFQCGGDKANCANGPGSDILDKEQIKDQKVKFSNVSNTQKEFDLEAYEAPINLNYTTNLYLSNFHSDSSCVSGTIAGEEYLYHSNKDGTTPGDSYLVDYSKGGTPSLTDPNASFLSEAGPTYEYRCADGSGVTKAKITLIIRDWNNSFSSRHDIDEALPNDDLDGTNGPDIDQGGIDPFGDPMNYFEDISDNLTSGDMCTNEDANFDFENSLAPLGPGPGQSSFPGDKL